MYKNLLLFIINFKLFFVKPQFFLFISKKISIHIVVTIPDQFLFLIWSPMLSATTPAANLNGTTFQDWLASGCLITIFSHTHKLQSTLFHTFQNDQRETIIIISQSQTQTKLQDTGVLRGSGIQNNFKLCL